MDKPNGKPNGAGIGGIGAGAEDAGAAARDAYYAQAARVSDVLRAHLDEFGETLRRARRVEAIDRRPTDREVALQLRLTAATFIEVADGVDPDRQRPPRPRDEVTTETKRIKKRAGDSEPGRKRS